MSPDTALFSNTEETVSKAIFSAEELAAIDLSRVPQHVAIIMDGNRRWARQQGLPPIMGHWEGAEVLTDVVQAASEIGIKTLTVFSFSTENWRRPEIEIDALMNIFEIYMRRKKEMMIQKQIRLEAIGDLSRLPLPVIEAFRETQKATRECDKINLVLALNYGGRDEIRRAVAQVVNLCEQGQISAQEVTEELISRHLDTAPYGDPELLIRTSGELRISNFLLWQLSYAELYVTDVLWPDFSPRGLLEAVAEFQARSRRKGG
jgi:undecaprenyl diphosphate synthase